MRTTDNNGGKTLTELGNYDFEDLSSIANRNLVDLQIENPDLLIFPQSLGLYRDDVEKSHIFSLNEDKLQTFNLMGFVGKNNTQLSICSRFAKNDQKDFFLHYMLHKVFSINLLKFDQTPNKDNIWDFLLYLFPYFLKKAYSQGIFKAYTKVEYNDANIKGTINIKRHIRFNIPFAGKIAYTTREYSYDNVITQLVRHTIEHIKTHTFGYGVLTNDSEIRDIVSKFLFVTQNSYNKNVRQKIINKNLKPVSHPYFTHYKMLQKICLRILRREKITYGNDKDKIYGLLFDGAWLWEEYLNTILKNDFIHPENKTGKHKNYLFEDNQSKSFQEIYPDFLSKSFPIIVGDAKYIPLGYQNEYSENSEKAKSVYYKTITYMYRFKSNYGFLVFPHPETYFDKIQKIKDTDGKLRKIGVAIPSNDKFIDFIKNMKIIENELSERLKT